MFDNIICSPVCQCSVKHKASSAFSQQLIPVIYYLGPERYGEGLVLHENLDCFYYLPLFF
jgi:hypothetical protein